MNLCGRVGELWPVAIHFKHFKRCAFQFPQRIACTGKRFTAQLFKNLFGNDIGIGDYQAGIGWFCITHDNGNYTAPPLRCPTAQRNSLGLSADSNGGGVNVGWE